MALLTASQLHDGAPSFDSAKSCKAWLKTVALANVHDASQRVLEALRTLNGNTALAPLERLTCLELIREHLALLSTELRSRYVGKGLPLAPQDMAAWKTGDALLVEMETGYRRCYADARPGGPLETYAALILQRAVRYLGLSMLMAGRIYRRFDAALWIRLHAVWQEAHTRGFASASVKDSVGTADGRSSVEQAYAAVLLGQLADPYALNAREVDFVDALLKRFGHKAAIVDAVAPIGAATLGIDPDAAHGAEWDDSPIGRTAPYRLDTERLGRSLKQRLLKLNQGATPQTLDLPADWSSADAARVLTRLLRRWCEGGEPHTPFAGSAGREVTVAFGIADAHFLVSGIVFEPPGGKRELSREEMRDIAMFGKISQATLRARFAGGGDGTETWTVLGERAAGCGELRVLRPASSARPLAIGKLVGVKNRNGGEPRLGVVREIVENAIGRFEATIVLLPGRPQAVAMRTSGARMPEPAYVPGFRLPADDATPVPETFIVPPALAKADGGLDVFHPAQGEARPIAAVRVVECGMDFDRVQAAS